MNIWQDLKAELGARPIFILAPMEAVTDTVFRRVIIKAGRPDLFFTEFTNAEGWNSPEGQKIVGRRLKFSNQERPLIAQIWSSSPENVAKMSQDLAKMGFDGIDLNMGCPVKTATKHLSGSALIKHPELAGQMIQAAKTSGLPVSVKTRLGYSKVEEWQDWLSFLLQQDLAALTVHARTKKEMSKVPAHHELFGPIVKLRNQLAPQTLIIANGDILSLEEGLDLAQKYQVDGVMIGRGVFQNIHCFNPNYNTEVGSPEHKKDLLSLLHHHLELFEEDLKDHPFKKFDPLKRFFKIYVRDFDGASELRAKLMDCKNLEEVKALLNSED
jgi:tRNA-dihydrouridine synthase